MVVSVGDRVKLANDVTYKRYVYCPGRKGKRLMWATQDELDYGETGEDGGERVYNIDESAVRVRYSDARVSGGTEG